MREIGGGIDGQLGYGVSRRSVEFPAMMRIVLFKCIVLVALMAISVVVATIVGVACLLLERWHGVAIDEKTQSLIAAGGVPACLVIVDRIRPGPWWRCAGRDPK